MRVTQVSLTQGIQINVIFLVNRVRVSGVVAPFYESGQVLLISENLAEI